MYLSLSFLFPFIDTKLQRGGLTQTLSSGRASISPVISIEQNFDVAEMCTIDLAKKVCVCEHGVYTTRIDELCKGGKEMR